VSAIIHNATIITPAGDEVRVLPEHSLAFADGRVTELLPASAVGRRVEQGEFAAVIAGERYLVIPGLVNGHHHLYQSLTRCLPAVQDRQLFDWLVGLYPYWRRLDYDAVRTAALVSLGELLLHGCTTTNDHFYMMPPAGDARLEAVLEAAETLGIRLHLCRGSMTLGASAGGLPPDDCVERDADVLADYVRVLDAYHDPAPYAMCRIDLAPCSPFNVTREMLRDTRVLARERGVLLHTHLAETLSEEKYCRKRYRQRPVRYLEGLDWLGPDVYLAHCVWLSEAERRLLGQTRTGVVHCPSSNMRLGSGLAPVRQLLNCGVRVGLGVDGSSSQDGGNLLAEVKQALLTARVRPAAAHADRARPGPLDDHEALFPVTEAFRLATTGTAACLNRPELGHLQPGAAADFAMFCRDDLSLAGAVEHDPLAALVLCAAPRAERVYVAGREVVRDGTLVATDELVLARRLNELVSRQYRGTGQGSSRGPQPSAAG
jgi:cytosine/adenosine deaminase-related metal-dependent hydrolase